MPAKLHLPEEQIINEFQSGATIEKLSIKYGVSQPTVNRVLRRHNIHREYDPDPEFICQHCNCRFTIKKRRTKNGYVPQFCSHRCHGKSLMKRKEGEPLKWKTSSGYVMLRYGGYAGVPIQDRPEHIVVWEEINGPVPEGKIVHHLNGVKDDNRIENLVVVDKREHMSIHMQKYTSDEEKKIARSAQLKRYREKYRENRQDWSGYCI